MLLFPVLLQLIIYLDEKLSIKITHPCIDLKSTPQKVLLIQYT